MVLTLDYGFSVDDAMSFVSLLWEGEFMCIERRGGGGGGRWGE